MKVAILGAGPAGLLAAHAVAQAGREPIILSKKVKSKIGGAQFVHIPIMGATESTDAFQIKFDMVGTGEGYTRKLYHGMEVPVLSSWHNYEDGGTRTAYPIQKMYDRLWDRYESTIRDCDLDQRTLDSAEWIYDLVVSTIPRYVLDGMDAPGEGYVYREVWIREWPLAKSLGDNAILYNGQDDGQPLYRMSNIQGNYFAEFTSEVPGSFRVVKPVTFTGIDRRPDIFKVGRYGKWSKMKLVHHAYQETYAKMMSFSKWGD